MNFDVGKSEPLYNLYILLFDPIMHAYRFIGDNIEIFCYQTGRVREVGNGCCKCGGHLFGVQLNVCGALLKCLRIVNIAEVRDKTRPS